ASPKGLWKARPTQLFITPARGWLSRNTVEIGASHGLLLSWVWEPTRYQGGCDYDATRTMHAAARCDGPVLGSIDGTGTDYPARGRSPSACGHRPNQSTPLYADPRSRLLGGAGHGNLDRAADPPSLQARTPASLRRGDPSSVQPVRGPTTSGHRPGPPPVLAARSSFGRARDARGLLPRVPPNGARWDGL